MFKPSKERDLYEQSLREYLLFHLTNPSTPYRIVTSRQIICDTCVALIDLAHTVMLSLWWILDPNRMKQNTFCSISRKRCIWCKRVYRPLHVLELKEERKQIYNQRNCQSFRNWKFQVIPPKLESLKPENLIECACCGSICFSKIKLTDQLFKSFNKYRKLTDKEQFICLILLNHKIEPSLFYLLFLVIPEKLAKLINNHNKNYHAYKKEHMEQLLGLYIDPGSF